MYVITFQQKPRFSAVQRCPNACFTIGKFEQGGYDGGVQVNVGF